MPLRVGNRFEECVMNPRPPLSGSLACLVLLSSALLGSSVAASPASLVRPSGPRETLALHLPSAVSRGHIATPHAATSADGAWREFNLLQVWPAISAYDPAFDQLLSIGGSRPESWALPLSGAPIWQPLTASPWTAAIDRRASV